MSTAAPSRRTGATPWAVLVALAGSVAVSGCGADPGALAGSGWRGNVVGISHPTEIGTPVSFGGPMVLVNRADDDVVITDVRIDDLDGDIAFLGWTVRDIGVDEAGRSMATGVSEPFPPVDASTGVDVVRSSSRRDSGGELLGEQELVIGLRLTAPGRAVATGVRIEYRDGTGPHVLQFPLTAVLCGPRRDFADGCPPEP